ncbi:MAG: hypothetical protein KDB02_06370 [Acidimicrobiales bacterium]|nr:hypothetical protein [Acidimicrobiales bacterium]
MTELYKPPPDPRGPMFFAAAVVFGAVLLGAVAVAFFAGDSGESTSATTTTMVLGPDGSVVPQVERPSSLPRPNSGKKPEEAGDPGGWEQLTVFALVAVGMLGIGTVVFRGGKRTRARRAQWLAQSAPGQEELRREQKERSAHGSD